MSKFIYPLILLFSLSLNSQNPKLNTQNTRVTYADLRANSYEKDSTANAHYIYEKGYSHFSVEEDFKLVTNYEAKIKILNRDGFEEANIIIPVGKNDRTSEKIKNLKAATYNLVDGKMDITNLDPEAVFTEEFETYDLKKFTFPNISAGSVLVYSYDLISPFYYDFTTWRFQEDIPKAYSEFTARIPGNYEYYTTIRGELKLEKDTSRIVRNCMDFGGSSSPADCVETVFAMKDIPAFTSEKFLTTSKNYLSMIEYELKQITRLDGTVRRYTREWKDVDKDLETDKSIGRQLKKDRLVEGVLPVAISSLPLGLDKAQKIYQFVQNEYNWNEEYRIYGDMDLKDIISDKTGNVLGINVLLHNLLSSEGFDVLPVMSATREKGFPTKVHPVLSDFNYFFVQLKLDGKEYLLDATEKNLDFGRLPFRGLNSYARLIDFDQGSSWINIWPEDYSSIVYRDSIKVNLDGTSNGMSHQVLKGYHAYNYRNKLDDISKDAVFKELSNYNENTFAVETEVINDDDPSKSLEIVYELDNKSQKIGDKIYYNPFSFRFFEENPFKQDKRSYTIDFGYKDYYMYSAIIEIPEGFKVSSLPEAMNIGLSGKGGILRFNAAQINDSMVQVTCQLKFAYPSYPAEYYPFLKEFFNKILEVQSQSLIVIEENS
ncbi:DUF3857 domain-containing protein [Christiangramia sabulilitoris]|uniref:DUF3857 domain-containing protein n=1 Tax=Christiangramia sabulilitoris TaxID=2583991 RepID=A0A550I7R0_9FLAO|nr:DUF3857 domain-containing protein [Christiangramia sabulilitoris]TRO66991.1 DUF3857 domain-containing protein [Christiangramia sabulilitoris]